MSYFFIKTFIGEVNFFLDSGHTKYVSNVRRLFIFCRVTDFRRNILYYCSTVRLTGADAVNRLTPADDALDQTSLHRSREPPLLYNRTNCMLHTSNIQHGPRLGSTYRRRRRRRRRRARSTLINAIGFYLIFTVPYDNEATAC